MYTACSFGIVDALGLKFLEPLPVAFIWIALAAWFAAFAGLLLHMFRAAFPAQGETG